MPNDLHSEALHKTHKKLIRKMAVVFSIFGAFYDVCLVLGNLGFIFSL